MQKPDGQLEIVRQLYFGLSKECQQEFLKSIFEKPAKNHSQDDGAKASIGTAGRRKGRSATGAGNAERHWAKRRTPS